MQAPRLIILATWMDARDVHIAKYTARYQVLYPTAELLIVKSYFRYYFSANSARSEPAPAVPVIRDLFDNAPPSSGPKMLVHVFSNGGSCMLYHLYDLFAEGTASMPAHAKQNDNHILPLHTTIFDSVPGRWSYGGSTKAVLVGLPAGVMRWVAWPFVHLLGLWWVIKYLVLKVPEETHVWGLAHNDPARARERRRAYIYSEADDFVQHHAVEEHAAHAQESGYTVILHKFPKSKHVAHARSDPDQYWAVVQETWEASQA